MGSNTQPTFEHKAARTYNVSVLSDAAVRLSYRITTWIRTHNVRIQGCTNTQWIRKHNQRSNTKAARTHNVSVLSDAAVRLSYRITTGMRVTTSKTR